MDKQRDRRCYHLMKILIKEGPMEDEVFHNRLIQLAKRLRVEVTTLQYDLQHLIDSGYINWEDVKVG